MNSATANLVIEYVWAFLALLLAMFITAIVRMPHELAVAGSIENAGLSPASAAARYGRGPYQGRHARGRAGQVATGPPWGPAPEPPGPPR
jgi:hypothetical protein